MHTSTLHAYMIADNSPQQLELFSLGGEIIATGTQTNVQRNRVPIDEIHLENEAFQPRRIENQREIYFSKGHIATLAKCLKEPDSDLDPVTLCTLHIPHEGVKKLVLIDGYHRVAAYKAKGRKDIPAITIDANPLEAAVYSVLTNFKNTLNMTSSEKLNAYWTIFVAMTGQKGRTATLTKMGISNGTLQNFRVVYRSLIQTISFEEILTLNWQQAKNGVSDTDDCPFDPDETARKWAEQLFKQFGTSVKNSPEVFSDALAIYMGEQSFDALINYNIDRFFDLLNWDGHSELTRLEADF